MYRGHFSGSHFRYVLVLPTREGSKRMASRKVKNDWFERKARRMVRDGWFVSVEMPKRSGQTSARRTETFPTETDAKQFAKQMLSEKRQMEKHHIVAGTLLGAYLPVRRIISGSQLYSWVREQDQPL
jgi:hypothetical protein